MILLVAAEATAIVIIPTDHRWKCIRRFALIAAGTVKFLSNLPATSRFFAINVLAKIRKSELENLQRVVMEATVEIWAQNSIC